MVCGIMQHIGLERFLACYATASAERKESALAAAQRVLDSEIPPPADEPLYGLNELPRFFGLKHYTTLARLQVQRVGISFGGRLRYRVSDVRRWLQSAECQAIRQALWEKRKEHEQTRGDRTTVGVGDCHRREGGRP